MGQARTSPKPVAATSSVPARPIATVKPASTSRYRIAGSPAIDSHEAEADRLAEQVVGGPPVAAGAQRTRPARSVGPQSQSTTEAPASIDTALRYPGRPMSAGLRTAMESGFGCDFSRVRIHADAAAAASARDVGARAYTAGENIVFGAGEFAPGTADGRRLIAHELTHVMQHRANVVSPRLIQRKPVEGAKKESKGSMTIVAMHAKPGELTASGYVASGSTPVDITLLANEMTDEGKFEFIKEDDPTTQGFVEYRSTARKRFKWKLPKGYVTGSKVMVTVTPGEFSLENYAQQRFDSVPERIKSRLYGKRGKKLETPQEKLGFADFAERLHKRGITDAELILFQTRANSGVAWRHIDWATEWMEAADIVIGARAEQEKKTAGNISNFLKNAAQLPEISEEALALYRKRGSLAGMEAVAGLALEESGISLDQLEGLLDGMMTAFDSQMRIETAVALDRLEGGLLLMKERYVEDRKGSDAIVKMRAAAGRAPTLEKKAARDRAKQEKKKAEYDNSMNFLGTALNPVLGVRTSQSAKDLAEAEEKYKQANSAYLQQLDSISEMPVSSWRGFNTEQFFYGRGAYTPQYWLRSYITQALGDVTSARKKIGEDKRTLYKADVMVSHTKKVMGITPDSTIDKLIDDRVEDYKSAPFWERLLDILSLALMFVPGGAFITVTRFAVGAIQTLNAIEGESTNEILARPNLKTTGGSLGTVALNIVGNVGDAADLAGLVAKGVGKLSKGADVAGDVITHHADDVAKVTDDAGAAATKADLPTTNANTHTTSPNPSTGPEKPPIHNDPASPPVEARAQAPDVDAPTKPPDVEAPKKAPDDAHANKADESDFADVDAEVSKVPLNESSFMDVGAEAHKVPVKDGPQLGQKMGKRTADSVDRAPKRKFSDQEKRAMAQTEREMAQKKVDDAMQELRREDPALHNAISTSTARAKSNQTMAELYAQNPTRMRQYYDEYLRYVARKNAKKQTAANFDQYTKYRLSGERGAAGEMTDAFLRGSEEIMVKAPKPKSNLPGSDSISYRPSDKKIKYLDNKSLTTGSTVDEVSALERNLIKNLGDDISDIEKMVLNSDVPGAIGSDVLPRLKAAREELLAYTAKNPVTKANATRANVRDAFDSILRNHGIDRVVSRTGSGAGVDISKKLKDQAGFKVE